MKAEELRIGNMVYNPTLDEIRIIDHLDILDFFEGRLYRPFEPIQLTPRWLGEFGFEMVRENIKGLGGFVALVSDYKKGEIILHAGHNEYYFGWRLDLNTKIQYVHEVQNLYFSLMGDELTHTRSGSGK